MKTKRQKWLLLTIVVQLLIVTALIASKEILLRTGQTVKLELAPLDPRSLLQGDYVRLNYKISQLPSEVAFGDNYRVQLVLHPDENGVSQFKEVYNKDKRLAPSEVVITGWRRGDRNRLSYGI